MEELQTDSLVAKYYSWEFTELLKILFTILTCQLIFVGSISIFQVPGVSFAGKPNLFESSLFSKIYFQIVCCLILGFRIRFHVILEDAPLTFED